MAPALSKDFIMNFIDNQISADAEPLLQILDIRKLDNNNASGGSYRVRISDGDFSYSYAVFANTVEDQVIREGLDNRAHQAVIRVKSFKRVDSVPERPSFSIQAYVLLEMPGQTIGNPTQYKNKDTFAGYREAKQRQRENIQPSPVPVTSNKDVQSRKRPADQGNGGMSTQGQNITPIKMISPFINKWRIRGIVKGKEGVREIKTVRGPMKVFSFQIMDSAGDMIKVSCFGDQADRFNAIIHNEQCFYISGGGGSGNIRPANKKFNSTGHDYEIVLNKDSEAALCPDKISAVAIQYQFKPLAKVCEYSGETIDVLAIIEKVEDAVKISTKAGKEMLRRKVQLVDDSNTSVEMTLWDSHCEEYESHMEGNLIAIKGAFVREFNGTYTLGLSSGSIVEFDIDNERANELRRWYESERHSADIKSMSANDGFGHSFERDLRMIGVASNSMLGRNSANGEYFNVIALVTNIKEDNAIYKACVSDGCRKKLLPMDNNMYRCEKCDCTTPNFKYAAIVSIELSDLSGSYWATMFEETATKVLGQSAQELGRLQEDDPEEYKRIFECIRFKTYNCRIRSKSQMFNDQEQIKWSLYDMKPVHYDNYIRLLKKTIDNFQAVTMDDDDF